MFFLTDRDAVVIKMFKIRKAKEEEPTAPGQGKSTVKILMIKLNKAKVGIFTFKFC